MQDGPLKSVFLANPTVFSCRNQKGFPCENRREILLKCAFEEARKRDEKPPDPPHAYACQRRAMPFVPGGQAVCDTIHLFLARGADMVQGYPFYEGLVCATRMWLGLYKQYQPDHPELQL